MEKYEMTKEQENGENNVWEEIKTLREKNNSLREMWRSEFVRRMDAQQVNDELLKKIGGQKKGFNAFGAGFMAGVGAILFMMYAPEIMSRLF